MRRHCGQTGSGRGRRRGARVISPKVRGAGSPAFAGDCTGRHPPVARRNANFSGGEPQKERNAAHYGESTACLSPSGLALVLTNRQQSLSRRSEQLSTLDRLRNRWRADGVPSPSRRKPAGVCRTLAAERSLAGCAKDESSLFKPHAPIAAIQHVKRPSAGGDPIGARHAEQRSARRNGRQ
jgi:hypothetical protein